MLDRLVELLDDSNSEIRLNSIRLLGLLAETPKGKNDLKPALEKVALFAVADLLYCMHGVCCSSRSCLERTTVTW